MTHKTVREWGRIAVSDEGFTRGQANTLLAAARAHRYGGRDGTNILCDHHRFLRAQQMVGVIAGERCSVEILPKVDPLALAEDEQTVRRQLVHMLDVSLGLGLSTGDASAMARQAQSLLEIFIVAFADRLLSEMRRGFPRQYLGQEDNLRALRGQLNVVRQFTVNVVSSNIIEEFEQLDCNAVRNMMIGETLFRLNASWSYIDIVQWEPLVKEDAFPLLFRMLRLPLGKPDRKHQLIGEEHNRSGIHFHYARLDGARSNILFAFGKNPPEPEHPVKWEGHGTSKAKIKPNPKPENWNYNKRKNINKICKKARAKLPQGTRFFTPSKKSQFLLPM